MTCNVIPYKGREPFLFFSFCKSDAALAYPFIERLSLEGYRVCYDDGSEPERKELIKCLLRSAVCIFAVSEKAVNTHSFREDITFAAISGKKILTFPLANFPLRPSIELFLQKNKRINAYNCTDEEGVYQKIFQESSLNGCRDMSIHATDEQLAKWKTRAKDYIHFSVVEEDYGEDSVYIKNWYQDRNRQEYIPDAKDPVGPPEKEKEETPVKPTKGPVKVVVKPRKENKADTGTATEADPHIDSAPEAPIELKPEAPADVSEPCERRIPELVDIPDFETNQDEDGPTVDIHKEASEDFVDPDATVDAENISGKAVMIRLNTGELFKVDRNENRLGRAAGQVNILISGNQKISRVHAQLYHIKGKYMLKDLGAKNGTGVDGHDLEREEIVELLKTALIRLADEEFIFASDVSKTRIQKDHKLCFLRATRTGEIRLLEEGVLPLNRNTPWNDGVLKDNSVSRAQHAEIVRSGAACRLRALRSKNGTFLNGQKNDEGEESILHDGDLITIGVEESFEFHEINIR